MKVEDYPRAIEDLSQNRNRKSRIDVLEYDLRKIELMMDNLKATNYDKVSVKGGSSDERLDDLIDQKTDIENRIEQIKLEMKATEKALSMLDQIDRDILTGFCCESGSYQSKMTKLSEVLNYSEIGAYKKLVKALAKYESVRF